MREKFELNISTTDNLGIGLFKYSFLPQEKFVFINSSLAKMLKINTSELKKLNFEQLFFSEQDYRFFKEKLLADKNVRFHQAIFHHNAKDAIWVAITASYVVDNDHEYLEGIIENISEHKQLEKDLLLEKEFFQSLLDNIPDAIYFKDIYNRITKVNKFYIHGAGLKEEEIIGKTDFDFFPYEQAKSMNDDDNSIITTGKPIIGKIERTLLPNGTWNQVITTKIPMYDRQANIIGTMGITRDMTEYANLEHERLNMLINTMTILGKAFEMRDPYTFSHMRRVGAIATEIGKTLGWDDNRLLGIRLAGELHDIGKISIPLDILNKPGKLSELEFLFIKRHVDNCYSLIKDIVFPFPLAEAIRQHHERLDGSGYPQKLAAADIILEARILAVSDVLEAITHHRPYRMALGIEEAIEELKRGSGTRYDQNIVNVALELLAKNNNQPFWPNQSN